MIQLIWLAGSALSAHVFSPLFADGQEILNQKQSDLLTPQDLY